ncbi:MAG: alpha/beta hydrolase [Ktedonobacteraceae bacterium]|nr:alpha/beta hydrolase [Ktedonobacteraceae bacterium]
MNAPLVFLHGSGDNKRIWRFQIEQSGQALDLPGHGERADTLSADALIPEYAQAVYQIIQDELKLERPIIVGHSLGGAIALMMALDYGDELGGLILLGTGARLRVHPALLAEALEAPERAQRHLVEAALVPEHIPAFAEAILQEQGTPKAGVFYRDLQACNMFDIIPRLHEITVPTLILCGREDKLTPPKYSQFLAEKLTGVKQEVVLHVIPDAGHYVMREQGENVNEAIADWLAANLHS